MACVAHALSLANLNGLSPVSDTPTTRARGLYAEDLALRFLENNGLRLLTRNYEIKGGEIDLIMQADDTLVFVEVRARENFDEIHPFETVTKPKQARIMSTAKHFLTFNNRYDRQPCRFDVVAVNLSTDKVEWLDNAF